MFYFDYFCFYLFQPVRLLRLNLFSLFFKGITKNNINGLQKLQNKAARQVIMTTFHYYFRNCTGYLSQTELTSHFVYKCLAHQSPSDYLTFYIHVPLRSLRSSSENLLAEHHTVSRAGAHAFFAAAPNVWNTLPTNLRHAITLGRFKKLLTCKTHLYRNT